MRHYFGSAQFPIGLVLFLSLLGVALTCLVLLTVLAHFAPSIELLDHPRGRKLHVGSVPLVGGIAIFASASLWLLLETNDIFVVLTIVCGFAALIVGVADDKMDLSAKLRFLLQIGIALFLTLVGGLKIVSMGDVLGFGPVLLTPVVSVIFTVFCFVGVLNAMNMSDGVDGLLGLVSVSSLSAIGLLCFQSGNIPESLVCLYFVAALVPYLVCNLGLFGSTRRIFLGDGGSMMLGLVLVALFIRASQASEPAFNAVVAGWLLGLPLLDSVVVMARRVMKGLSPFEAGRDHFHHMLLDAGIGPRKTVAMLVAIHWLFLVVGLSAHYFNASEGMLFWSFVLITLLHFRYTPRLVGAIGVAMPNRTVSKQPIRES